MQQILVIEDEEAIRANIADLLEAENFKVLAAENGRIGVEIAQKHIPDLIICDVRMPELDGTGVLKSLRADPSTATIPFIFLTASGEKSEMRRGMELGADDYLVKPCSVNELLQAIATRLTKQLIVKQLQEQIHELQQLSAQKDDFLSEASHDLRAPLANMKIAIQLLKVVKNEEQRERYLKLLESECDRETALLNDLLDLQRLEADAYQVEQQPLSLETWIPYVLEAFESRTQERQQTLKVQIEPGCPPLISDPNSLERVITELLNNACKYTLTGGDIIFRVSKHSTNCLFEICNQGGIPEKDLPHIFERFYRASNTQVTQQSGTGLGLTLVKKLVEQLTGSIQVESQNGWTTFTIHLPLKPDPFPLKELV
ncbi:MAG: response regulator [Scytolyngbya sp. HA4215-MV1]|jgi:signal transduction histidine kinase|nr:response regulator [Scytolyngbya sp. HA4215-MV1]